MKNNIIKSLFTILTFNLLLSLVSAKQIESYTLPNGKILIKPYIISNNPNGLEVGFRDGIIQVPFTELPKTIQKKYNYAPEKAAKYRKEKALKNKRYDERKKAKLKAKKIENKKFAKYRLNTSIKDMEIQLEKLNLQITKLKKDIPRLDINKKEMLNNANKLAGKKVSSNSVRRNQNNYNGYSSYGGYYQIRGQGNSRAENTKKRQVQTLDNNYAKIQREVKRKRKELSFKQNHVINLKAQLNKAKERKAKEKE